MLFGSVISRLEDVDQLQLWVLYWIYEYKILTIWAIFCISRLTQQCLHSKFIGLTKHFLIMEIPWSHENTTKCSIELPKLNIYENSWTSWYLLKLTIIMVDQETLSTCTFGKITRTDRKVILNIISHIYLTMCDIMIYHLRYRLKLRVNYKVLLISEKCIKWSGSQNLKKE